MGEKLYAAGLVVYRIGVNNVFEYLLLKASYPPFHYTPPKGHVDAGEKNHLVTAFRETQEEAGLSNEDLDLEDCKEVIQYEVRGKLKEVTYWLARLKTGKKITLSDEHTDLAWVPCEEATRLIGHQTTGNIIRHCQNYLENKFKV